MFLLLASEPVQAQFVEGFGNPNLPRRPICRNYISLSREATALGTKLQESPNNGYRDNKMSLSEYIKDFDVILENKQLQRKFKHAKDFGVKGNFNPENLKLFKDAILSHMKDPTEVSL